MKLLNENLVQLYRRRQRNRFDPEENELIKRKDKPHKFFQNTKERNDNEVQKIIIK